MDSKQKQAAKHKLGLCINRIISRNKAKGDLNLVTSLRKLAAACDVEYSIIQKITSGKKDPQHTTIMSIIEGFSLSPAEFFSMYEHITDEEVASLINPPKKRNSKNKSRLSK